MVELLMGGNGMGGRLFLADHDSRIDYAGAHHTPEFEHIPGVFAVAHLDGWVLLYGHSVEG